ncbi:hypothetical protein RQP46_000836 [Phenoliferia psychrophenolica]
MSEAEFHRLLLKAKLDGIDAAVRALSKGMDDLDQAGRAAGLISMYIGLDMSNQVKGLRYMHKNFNAVYSKLQKMFPLKEEQLHFGICHLLSDLSRDRVLRDKLVAAGAIHYLVGLLAPTGKACYFALETLSRMSGHAGPQEQETIAKVAAKPLVDLALKMDREDERYPILLAVIAHGAFIGNDLTGIPSKTMIGLLVDASSHPDRHTHIHAVSGIFSLCHRYPKYFRTTPKLLHFFLGHLRHPDPRTRLEILWGLYSLTRDIAEFEPVLQDPKRMPEGMKQLSKDPEIAKMMSDYGTADTFAKVVRECMRLSEFAIAEGMFRIEDGRHPLTGEPTFKNVPARLQGDFLLFTEALPFAVKALRTLNPNSLDAILIECKYLMVTKRWSEAHPIAKKALKLYPDESYLYYVLTIANPDNIEGLRWAKRGLRTNATGYIQRGLLMLSFEHSHHIAGVCAGDGEEDDFKAYSSYEKKFDTGLAHIVSAMGDAKTFIDISPPDARHLRMMILRYLIFAPIVLGNTLSPDLRELKPYYDKLAVVDKICVLLYDQTRNTQQRLVWNLMKSDYEKAAMEWDAHFSKFGEASETLELPTPSPDKGLERLMASMKCSGGDALPPAHYRIEDITKLLRCSSCLSPSAQPLKCSGCGRARYCDLRCQTTDWKLHKVVCQKKKKAAA